MALDDQLVELDEQGIEIRPRVGGGAEPDDHVAHRLARGEGAFDDGAVVAAGVVAEADLGDDPVRCAAVAVGATDGAPAG